MNLLHTNVWGTSQPVQLDGLSPITMNFPAVEASSLVRANEARDTHGVYGESCCVVVLDTGINKDHQDFDNRIWDVWDFTKEGGDGIDRHGHGSHVAGIVGAKGVHIGIAPAVKIVSGKVLRDNSSGNFEMVAAGLQRVSAVSDELRIVCVCLSLGDNLNHNSDANFANHPVTDIMSDLRENGVSVCIAAGNLRESFDDDGGMQFPAIVDSAISVSAVYDEGQPDVVTRFAQRLSKLEATKPNCETTLLAPGADVVSTGIRSVVDKASNNGTSQAVPIVAGAIVLGQELYHRNTDEWASVDYIQQSLLETAVQIDDGNHGYFHRLDIFAFLNKIDLDTNG